MKSSTISNTSSSNAQFLQIPAIDSPNHSSSSYSDRETPSSPLKEESELETSPQIQIIQPVQEERQTTMAAFYLQEYTKSKEEKMWGILTEIYNICKEVESEGTDFVGKYKKIKKTILEPYEQIKEKQRQEEQEKMNQNVSIYGIENDENKEKERGIRRKKASTFTNKSKERNKSFELEFELIRQDSMRTFSRTNSTSSMDVSDNLVPNIDRSLLSEEERKELTRQDVISEIITTEADYVRYLELVVQVS